MAVLMRDADPAVKLRAQLVAAWLLQWLVRPDLHRRVRRVWPYAHRVLLRAKGAK